MDKITNHVMTEGFNEKIRNLREEFFSRVEFKSQMNNFIKHKDLDGVEKTLLKTITEMKNTIQELVKNENEMNGRVELLSNRKNSIKF